jgi:hypothetical protein
MLRYVMYFIAHPSHSFQHHQHHSEFLKWKAEGLPSDGVFAFLIALALWLLSLWLLSRLFSAVVAVVRHGYRE